MIREASTADIPAISALAEIAFRDTYKEILSPGQMDYMMEWMYSSGSLERQMTQEGNVFVIDDGRGYASIRPDGLTADGRPLFHLEKIYLLPQFQKSGLGRELFAAVVEKAREMAGGAPFRVELNVNRNNPSLGFYEHLGMHKDRQGDFPIGNGYYMNDFIMAKDFSE